jgi:MFS family permease
LSPTGIASRLGVHYGWVVVGATFVLILIATGVRATPSVLIRPLESDLGWSRGEISWVLSVSLLTLGLAGPASGKMLERFGLRATVVTFLAVAAIGTAAATTMEDLWQFHLYWGVLVGFGSGGVSIVLAAAIANTWFEQRRGLVTGVLGGASSAGGFIFLRVLLQLVDVWSWRWAIAFMTLLITSIALPVALLLLRNRPADAGVTVYGSGAGSNAAPGDTRTTSMRTALRTFDFWLLSLSFGICGFTTIGIIGTHFIPHATEHGFTSNQAAGILTVMGLFNIGGTIGSGWLTDRYSPRRLLAFYYFLRAISLLVLPLMTNMSLMTGFAVLFGADYIATVPPTVMLTAERFGRRSVATIYGWISFTHMAGAAVSAALAGQIHDATGDYAVAIYLSGMLGVLAAAMAFNVGAKGRRDAPGKAKLAPAPA